MTFYLFIRSIRSIIINRCCSIRIRISIRISLSVCLSIYLSMVCLATGNFGGDSSDVIWLLVFLVVRCGRKCAISSQNWAVG